MKQNGKQQMKTIARLCNGTFVTCMWCADTRTDRIISIGIFSRKSGELLGVWFARVLLLLLVVIPLRLTQCHIRIRIHEDNSNGQRMQTKTTYIWNCEQNTHQKKSKLNKSKSSSTNFAASSRVLARYTAQCAVHTLTRIIDDLPHSQWSLSDAWALCVNGDRDENRCTYELSEFWRELMATFTS